MELPDINVVLLATVGPESGIIAVSVSITFTKSYEIGRAHV